MSPHITSTTTAEQRIKHHITQAQDQQRNVELYHELGRAQDEKQAYNARWWHLRAISWIQAEWSER